MNKFKKNPQYLLLYCLYSLILFLSVDIMLFFAKDGIDFNLSFEKADLFFILLPIFFCGLPSSIMHNCAHKNIRPLWLNNILGEICGLFMIYGFKGFALAHMFHHLHPDDPQMDPHPPQGKNFLKFVVSPIKSTLVVVERAYFGIYGKNENTKRSILIQLVLFNLCLIARTLFWFLLLGPKYFLIGYLPVYLANIFVFAHINFAAHRERDDCQNEIININHNLYYKFVNVVSFGGYFHKTHHLKPGLFNPSKVSVDESKQLLTYLSLNRSEL